MPTVKCPQCAAALNLAADAIGRNVRCPKCSTVFAVEGGAIPEQTAVSATPPAASPTSYSDRPPDSMDDTADIRRGSDAWATARGGLKVVFVSVAILLATMTVSQTMMIAVVSIDPTAVQPVPGQPPRGNAIAFGLANAGLGCVMLIVMIAGFVGMVLLATAPDPTTRGRVFMTIGGLIGMILVSVGLGIYMVFRLMGDPAMRQPQPDPRVFERIIFTDPGMIGGFVFAIALFLIAGVFWFLAHASVAAAVNDMDLRRFALRCLSVCLAVMLVSAGVNGAIRFAVKDIDQQTILLVSGVCGMISNLVVYGIYLVLCRRTIRAISPSV